MPINTEGKAPYAPPAAVIDVIEAYREKGLSTPFTNDVLMRAGVSESLAPRTLQALGLLDLIDNKGEPTDQFEALRVARGPDEYQNRLQEWLQSVYADTLSFADPATDSPDRLVEAFRTNTPAGQRGRMVTSIVGLWEYAGLREKSTPQAKAATARKSTPKKATKKTAKPSPGLAVDGLPTGLVGLLGQIPTNGGGWTSDERKLFLDAFTAVLDFTVPVVAKTGTRVTGDEEES